MFGEATAQKSHCQTVCSSDVTWKNELLYGSRVRHAH